MPEDDKGHIGRQRRRGAEFLDCRMRRPRCIAQSVPRARAIEEVRRHVPRPFDASRRSLNGSSQPDGAETRGQRHQTGDLAKTLLQALLPRIALISSSAPLCPASRNTNPATSPG